MNPSEIWRLKLARAKLLVAKNGEDSLILPQGIYERYVEKNIYEINNYGDFVLVKYLFDRETKKWTKKEQHE